MRCVDCDSKLVPIMYGFPSRVMWKKAKKGKAKLGGCFFRPQNFYCPKCERELIVVSE